MKWISSTARFLVLVFMLSGVSVFHNSAKAQPRADCPTTLSTIDKGVLSRLVSEIIQETYQELGCRVKFIALPGRRGIVYFNNKQVNGEVMRLEKAEAAYRREFVRSAVPLLVLTSSLWLHPNQPETGNLPVGYTLGIVWQENYIRDKRGRKFSNAEELFKAYNAGEISGFLSADMNVKVLMENGQILPRPIKRKTIITAPLYHYLGQEFAPFMMRFSALLQSGDPFALIIDLKE